MLASSASNRTVLTYINLTSGWLIALCETSTSICMVHSHQVRFYQGSLVAYVYWIDNLCTRPVGSL